MSERRHPLVLTIDPLRCALFLLTVITISRIHQHLGLDAFRPALLLAGVSVVYIFLNPRAITLDTTRTWLAGVVLAIGVVACMSVPFGISLGASARYLIVDFSKVLLFALLLMLAVRTAHDTMLFIAGYVVGCALLVWMSITVFEPSLASGSDVLRLADMYSYDSNDAGLVLVMGLPLCLLLVHTGGAMVKTLGACVFVGSTWAIALTGSRGAFLALAIMGVGLFFLLRSVRLHWRLGAVGAVLAALVIAAPPGYWKKMGTLLTPQSDYNWSETVGRVAIARRGIGYMLDHPVLGIGLANFGRAEGTISSVALDAMPGTGVAWNAPHNSYVQAGAELGVPGGLLFLTLVFGGMFSMLWLRRRLPTSWEEGLPEERFLRLATSYLFLAYLGFATGAFFLSFAYLDPVYVLTAFAAGVHASVRRRLGVNDPPMVRAVAGMRGGALASTGPWGSDDL